MKQLLAVALGVLTLMTMAAEIGGIALAVELLSGVNYLLFVPACAFLVWFVIWRMPFELMERVFGLAGLAMVVFLVALWHLHPAWATSAIRPCAPPYRTARVTRRTSTAPSRCSPPPSAPTRCSSSPAAPSRSSGRRRTSPPSARTSSSASPSVGCSVSPSPAAPPWSFSPRHVDVGHLSQSALPVALSPGKVGLAVAILGFVAVTS